MFKTVISSTPLTDNIADDFFSNITSDAYCGDISMISTLRALVAPRMGKDDKLHVVIEQTSYSVSQMSGMTKKTLLDHFVDGEYVSQNTVIIHNFAGSQESIQYSLDLVKSSFCSEYSGWHPLENVTTFFRKQFPVLCYVDPDQRRVVIFTGDMNIRRFHYLQCSVLAFLPWYFNQEKGVSELEMDLIKSLKEKSSEMYESCIAKIAEQYDFRTARIKKLLDGFEMRFERQYRDDVVREIREIDSNIEYYYEHIAECMRNRRDLNIKLLGLDSKIAQGSEDSEIMQYFLANNNIKLENVTNQTMTFTTMEYLEYYDEDMVDSAISNDNSYVYAPHGRRCNNIIPHDDMKMFMEAVFLEQRLRIKVCAAYLFDLGVRVNGLSNYPYSSEYRNCTPNPHIDGYSCMGNYKQAISKLIKDNNYIMALEQCIASCKSLNFGDGTVMSEFMSRIYGISDSNANMRCVELPDGRVVTPKEAIVYLKTEESEDEQAD